MSAGLAALLDDIAALARLAAASVDDVGAAAGRASVKAAGVVVDDTAVTPRYVQGLAAQRELPIIRKIAVGSLRNKILFILPAALLLSQFAPWLLTPILMLGGTYLSFEGAEKLLELVRGGHEESEAEEKAHFDEEHEKKTVAGAIRTDFILSAEIMVIALNEVREEPLVSRAIILAVVAVVITLLVYGVVALIVKMDDIGLALAQKESAGAQRLGRTLVRAMPVVLRTLSVVGIVAMLWVGGHILLVGMDELGLHAPYAFVHHAEEAVHHAVPAALAGTLAWLTNTFFSFLLGLAVGLLVVTVLHPFLPHGKGHEEGHATQAPDSADSAESPENPAR